MQVTCDRHDQNLLFLAHGMLSLPRAILLRLHLRRCEECRARLAELHSASDALRSEFGAEPRRPVPAAATFRRRILIAALAVLLFACGYAAYNVFVPPGIDPGFPPPSKDCEPGQLQTPM